MLLALLWPCVEFPASRGVSSWCQQERVSSQQLEMGHVSSQGTWGSPAMGGKQFPPVRAWPPSQHRRPPTSAPPPLGPAPPPRPLGSSSLGPLDTLHSRVTVRSFAVASLLCCSSPHSSQQALPSSTSLPWSSQRVPQGSPSERAQASPRHPRLSWPAPPHSSPASWRSVLSPPSTATPVRWGRAPCLLTAAPGSLNRPGPSMSQEA